MGSNPTERTNNREKTTMSDYVEQNPPFPLLQDKLKVLIKQYYEAEWEDNDAKKLILKADIDSLERRMDLGEKYEVPF